MTIKPNQPPSQPYVEVEGIGEPPLSEEQSERFDRLMDNAGFNRIEALRAVGAPIVEAEVENGPAKSVKAEEAKPSRPKNPSYRNADGSIKRSRLSGREKLLADQPPAHIRERLPYPR